MARKELQVIQESEEVSGSDHGSDQIYVLFGLSYSQGNSRGRTVLWRLCIFGSFRTRFSILFINGLLLYGVLVSRLRFSVSAVYDSSLECQLRAVFFYGKVL